MNNRNRLYHGYRFPTEIISHSVWLYHRFCLSFRDVEDILVQKRKDKQSAVRFFKKLMKGQGCSARKIVTDKLPSYGAARKEIMPTSMHCHERYANNRRCDGSSHLARRNVSWPFTVRFTISFASAGIYLVRPIIGC